MKEQFSPQGNRFYCSYHATWLLCKTSISSKNYKIVPVNSKMTFSDFMFKVANIFNVCKELICVMYEFPQNVGEEQLR